ncbi:helix-turn-helix domain-containing protein [Vibrio sp. D431a]|uniref:helix-turn-helix domain-containing protein n=1 Tax=Vibrio sp. D431a TaxID=2837388 RepID=UPI002554E305|nr:helix-turn-helix transcriptional regulator [Vibrio sp. D431a]MDK9789924.1 helix-turn-helix transcriptional regulator [Vibrio sp. D431a]
MKKQRTYLGKYLRTLRVNLDETGKEMAVKLNVSPTTLFSIEHGERRMTDEALDKLVKTYQLSDEEHLKVRKLRSSSVDSVHINLKNSPNEAKLLASNLADNIKGLSIDSCNKISKLILKESKNQPLPL